MQKIYLFFASLVIGTVASYAQTPAMIKDIYPGLTNSNPENLTQVNGIMFFSATDNVNGTELWKSDGTAAGTQLVKDITSGSANSSPRDFINVNGTLYFIASAGSLYKSDGTTAGTIGVSGLSYPASFTNVNGTLFFTQENPTYGRELWKSDGTAVGTVLVKDINPGTSSFPGNLTTVNGTLFFTANDGNGIALWKSDGTTTGTVLLKTLNVAVLETRAMGGIFFFVVSQSGVGRELWKSDGTIAGTVIVKDINPGSSDAYPEGLMEANGALFFQANDGTNGKELWKSDGTAGGTVMVKDIRTGASSSSPSYLTNVNGTLFFVANDGALGKELWKTDGTTGGTVLVKDIVSGTGTPFSTTSLPFPSFLSIQDTLYFTANDGVNGLELWKSDGTNAGTVLLKDIYPGSSGSGIPAFATASNRLFFNANDGSNGAELWSLNSDITTGVENSPESVNAKIYPNPCSGVLNIELAIGEILSIKVNDLLGKQVFGAETLYDNKINLNMLNSGIYFIEVQTNYWTITQKIVIQN
ncbi:MAG: hypothetical protein K0S53_3142 [Bacteroidetes bacterium]|jgi:ELWxxDGT repeat protein|nr:hypothetical protein [Bacteroidota bacterium]MDF2453585.1 hypothetical protein [Bacteroidota bacterium]